VIANCTRKKRFFGGSASNAGELSSFFANIIDWEKIKKQAKRFVAIHSDNDPWVPLEHHILYQRS